MSAVVGEAWWPTRLGASPDEHVLAVPLSPAADVLPPAFQIDVQPDRERIRIRPAGELDLSTVDELTSAVTEVVDAGFPTVVLDLRDLTFIDSTGLHLCLRLHHASQADGWSLTLIQGPAAVQRVFEVSGIGELLPFSEVPA